MAAAGAPPRRGQGQNLTLDQRDWCVMMFDRLHEPDSGDEPAVVTAILEEWPTKFPGEAPPARGTVYYQVKKQRRHKTLQNRQRGPPKRVLTEEKVEEVQLNCIRESTYPPAAKRSSERRNGILGVSQSSYNRARHMRINHVLTGNRKLWGYAERKTPWYGEDPERTKRLRLACAGDVVTRGDAFFRDLVSWGETDHRIAQEEKP